MSNISHVFYSTSNTPYQHWQCDLLEYSFNKVQQDGKLWCLCSENEHDKNFTKKRTSKYSEIVKCPDWMKVDGKLWGIANKLESMKYWLDNNPSLSGTILFLDPDMCFVKPINEKVPKGKIIGQRWNDADMANHPMFKKYCPENLKNKLNNEVVFMYPFLINVVDLKKIVNRFVEISYEIHRNEGKWEADMYGIVIAALEMGLEIETKEIGCCNNWKNQRNNDYAVVHYPGRMLNCKNENIWFKQDFTKDTLTKPWKLKVHPNETTNKIEYQLIQTITELVRIQILERNTQMLYWNNVDLRDSLQNYHAQDKYISFQPWPGGFNNIRMSLEIAAVFAFLFNRKLVLPDKYHMYLLKNKSNMGDFFDKNSFGLHCISLTDFCKLKNIPNNWKEVEKISHVYDKVFDNGYICVPEIPKEDPIFSQLIKNRIVNELCDNDHEIIHFPKNLLGSFYLNIYSKRMKEASKYVAKHIHYKEHMFAEAYGIIDELGDREYYAIHIRRNDHQYKNLFISAEKIYQHIRDIVPEKSKLYIATDCKDKSFFNVLNEKYQTSFYSDYKGSSNKYLDYNLIGMIEQLICTRAKIFIGNDLSTFSSYIYRLRGYMRDIENKEYYLNTKKCLKNIKKISIKPTWIQTWMSTWGREHPEVWDFSNFNNETIFISIAAYRDPELEKTIADCFEMAEYPERLVIGVCLQDTLEKIENFKYKDHPQIRLNTMEYTKAKGVCYARWIIQTQLTGNEKYYLQIDSHSRFSKHWDSTLIEQIHQCPTNKPILSTYPNGYNINDDSKGYLNTKTIANIGYDKWLGRHLRTSGKGVVKSDKPIPASWTAAGFLFTYMEWKNEVEFPKRILFNGEEDVLFIKSFTNGWDIYCPPTSTIYHCYNDCRKQSKVKYRPLVWEDVQIKNNMDDLLEIIDGKGDIGTFRNLEDLRVKYGVCYKKRLIEDWAKKGIVNDGSGNYSLKKFVKDKFLDSELEPKTFKINTSGLDITAKYKVWIFAIENEYGDEILRDDIYGKDYFTGKKNTYTISSSSILKKLPYNYILMPRLEDGTELPRRCLKINWIKEEIKCPRSFKLDTSEIDFNLKYEFWIFALEDENNKEILRADIYDQQFLTGKTNLYTITDKNVLKKKPYKYILCPKISNSSETTRYEKYIEWGDQPPIKKLTFELNTSNIDFEEEYKSWIFAIENEHNEEILRHDLVNNKYFTREKKHFTIDDPKVLRKNPYQYVLWPLKKNGQFGDKKIYRIK